ncbi:hypothetical protein [Tsukamurella paurometabola]|uniref:Uncharacterized protein n=1 Tax=Tsukamurella paurometabola TaxID=2061 RepID=A0A3P8LFV6_TSUPA|nr:hypothetical protein [Tsukamurella paurometabola]MBS4101052.1 hypothetical protein [Tsukamurella paurometabola]UEA82915.1 hypothetical protein LK411_21550 [Tsukamurella paurometabola]VDR39992.1 Uncharacterised protein [Tsukamurella paurometabola]
MTEPTASVPLRVSLASWMLSDGSPPPPVVGEIGEYVIGFREEGVPDPSDAGVTELSAEAIPRGAPSVTGRDDDRRMRWPTTLRGMGWEVSWGAPRPVIGPVRVRGTVYADYVYHPNPIRVRGRILRVRVASVLARRTTDTEPFVHVPGTYEYRDVTACPQWLDSSVTDDHEHRYEFAAVVDLDLADAPLTAPQPRISPDSVAVDGDRSWVIDSTLPIVVALDLADENAPTEHLLPGAVTTKDAYEIPTVWACEGACWAFRSDGVFRIADGAVTHVSTSPVDSVIDGGDTALIALREDRNIVQLYRIGIGDAEVGESLYSGDAPEWGIATESGFLLLTCNGEMAPEDRTHRLVRVGEAGEITVGPVLDDVGPNPDGFGGAPPRVFTGGMFGDPIALDVRPNLTVTRSARTAPRFGSVRTIGNDLYVVCHRPDGTGADGWWPLDGPCEYRSEEQFWLLVRLDGDTLEPVAVAPIHTTQVSVACHGDEFLVATGAGLYRWRGVGYSELEEIPLAALLDQNS